MSLRRRDLHPIVKTAQQRWSKAVGWSPGPPQVWPEPAQLVLVGGNTVLRDERLRAKVRHAYPAARLFGCSSAGEIAGTQVATEILASMHSQPTIQ